MATTKHAADLKPKDIVLDDGTTMDETEIGTGEHLMGREDIGPVFLLTDGRVVLRFSEFGGPYRWFCIGWVNP